jgi:hypothetical protein
MMSRQRSVVLVDCEHGVGMRASHRLDAQVCAGTAVVTA